MTGNTGRRPLSKSVVCHLARARCEEYLEALYDVAAQLRPVIQAVQHAEMADAQVLKSPFSLQEDEAGPCGASCPQAVHKLSDFCRTLAQDARYRAEPERSAPCCLFGLPAARLPNCQSAPRARRGRRQRGAWPRRARSSRERLASPLLPLENRSGECFGEVWKLVAKAEETMLSEGAGPRAREPESPTAPEEP